MRLLGAIRLSKETDESTSPQRQRADIAGDANARGNEVIAWPTDLDVSADKFSPFRRPQLGPWLRDRASEYDGVSFARADRAIRSMRDMHALSEWAITHRKVIIFVKGPGGGPRLEMDFRNGPLDTMTQFMVTVFAFAGEMELNLIKDRTQGSQALAREEGRWHGGTPPYGYMPHDQRGGKGWVLVPDPESAERVREIVRRILEGDSMNSVCQDFNRLGILTPSDHYRKLVGKPVLGRKWKTTALTPVLRSRTLLGIAEKGGEVVHGADGLPVVRAKPIITRGEWEQVQKCLDVLSRRKTRSAMTSPLLGVVFCIECREPLYRLITGQAEKPNRREYYRCRGRAEKRNDCTVTSVRADALEEVIESILMDAIGDLEVMEPVLIPAESHAEELTQATESLAYFLEMAAGKPEAVRKVYDAQIASLEERITRLSALPETEERTELRGTGKSYHQVWESADAAGRRKLLLRAGVRVEAAKVTGDGFSMRLVEQPGREDQAVKVGAMRGLRVAFYLPRDLAERATGNPAARLAYEARPLPTI